MFGEGVEDRLSNPPHRIGDELDVVPFLSRIILFRGLDQSEVALMDEVEKGNVWIPVALGISDHEAEVRLHHPANSVFVAGLYACGQLDLLLVIQGRISGDLLEISA